MALTGEIKKTTAALSDVGVDVFTIVAGAFVGRILLRGIARFAPAIAPYHSVAGLVLGVAGMIFIPRKSGLMAISKDLSGGLAISAGLDIADIALMPIFVWAEEALMSVGK